ncbi:MAG: hypothetical protein EA397_15630 [Deltaproteobacteria bacterium]|nr:MAG: hypothetical protein EA397_15630 [Deltaproteobacteria bacterium]
MERTDQERLAAVVADARRMVVLPARLLLALGALQIVAALGVYFVGKSAGDVPVASAGILLVAPGAILLIAARQIRRLIGWNLVFGGLMSSVGLWLLAAAVLIYEGMGMGAYVAAVAILLSLGVVAWMASFVEEGTIRGARSLIDPQPPRDPSDRGVF